MSQYFSVGDAKSDAQARAREAAKVDAKINSTQRMIAEAEAAGKDSSQLKASLDALRKQAAALASGGGLKLPGGSVTLPFIGSVPVLALAGAGVGVLLLLKKSGKI